LGILQQFAQHQAQGYGSIEHGHAELQQQAADAIDAGRAVFLEAFAQAVHAQQELGYSCPRTSPLNMAAD